jgi:hypothetical protein
MAITALEASAVPSWGRRPVRMRHPGLNLAAWITTAAHCHAEQNQPKSAHATQRFPGVAGIAVHRFTPYRAVAA